MKKTNNKSIILAQKTLRILSILAFSLIFIPVSVSAYATYTVPNPSPSVDSISPNSANSGENIQSIMINGSGFAPGSVARINGSNRITTFIDDSHLMMRVSAGDTYRTDGGFYVTVWNSAPGGGFSNSAFFNVSNTAVPATYSNNSNNYPQNNNTYPANSGYVNTYPTQTYNGTTNNPASADSASSLASNAVFGSNSFLPSGLIQWVLFGIIILLIIVLVRKIFGARDNYNSTPLKHD